MRSNEAHCVEGVQIRLKFFIESLFSLIFIVIHDVMLVGSSLLLSDVIELFILHVARDVARHLTGLQAARLGVLAKMKPGLGLTASEVSLVKHDLT